MPVPILSRLTLRDYLQVLLAFIIVLFEILLRLSIAIFPSTVVDYVRYKVIGIFPRVFRGLNDDEDEPFARMKDIDEMIEHWHYPFESHVVETPDGYLLGVHRIPYSVHERAQFQDPQNAATSTSQFSSSSPDHNSSKSMPPTLSSRSTCISPVRPGCKRIKTFDFILRHWRRVNGSYSGAEDDGSRDSFAGGGDDDKVENIDEDIAYYSVKEKPVVLLWHGFMMCSEVWVCSKENSLAYMFADAGYDVWMGNNRGNKYSYKHVRLSPKDEKFWDFSLDNYAVDVTVVVDYILEHTNQKSLIYIGFSQGTAQCFAALSVNKSLNNKIRLMIALAPTGKPHGLRDSIIKTLVQLSPPLLYLMFGRKSIIGSAPFWQRSLSRDMFVRVLDRSMYFLFNWSNSNMSHSEKRIHYQHLYSFASVKSVVHWFQIIRSSKFHMFDDDPAFMGFSSAHAPIQYPLANITTKIALFHGGADTLSDLTWLLQKLPPPVFVLKIADYEHLDCLWANSASHTVFPGVLGIIKLFGTDHPDGTPIPPPIAFGPTVPNKLIETVLSYGVFASNSIYFSQSRRKFSHFHNKHIKPSQLKPSILELIYSNDEREEIIVRMESNRGMNPQWPIRDALNSGSTTACNFHQWERTIPISLNEVVSASSEKDPDLGIRQRKRELTNYIQKDIWNEVEGKRTRCDEHDHEKERELEGPNRCDQLLISPDDTYSDMVTSQNTTEVELLPNQNDNCSTTSLDLRRPSTETHRKGLTTSKSKNEACGIWNKTDTGMVSLEFQKLIIGADTISGDKNTDENEERDRSGNTDLQNVAKTKFSRANKNYRNPTEIKLSLEKLDATIGVGNRVANFAGNFDMECNFDGTTNAKAEVKGRSTFCSAAPTNGGPE